MHKELSQILYVLEQMKKDTRKRGISPKKIEEGYDSVKRFKRHLKELKITLQGAHTSILNDKQTGGWMLNDIRIHLLCFIDYILNIQNLVQVFLVHIPARPTKLSESFLPQKKNSIFINQLEYVIKILEKINKDREILCV